MSKLKKFYKTLKNIYDYIPMICLMCMLLCVVIQIFTRFVIHVAVPWTQEGSCILMIYLCTFGMVITTRRGDHLGAYFLRDKTRGKPINNYLYLFSSVICFAVLVYIAYGCIKMYSTQVSTMNAVTIPWYQTRWNYIAMAIGCILSSLYFIRDFVWSIQMIKNKESVEFDGRSSPKKED